MEYSNKALRAGAPVIGVLCLTCWAAFAACETSGDAGRLVLAEGSRLEVTPSCIAMPTPTGDGPVSVQTSVFARDKHGRPAESLQVSIRIGSCDPPRTATDCRSVPVAGAGGNAAIGGDADAGEADGGSANGGRTSAAAGGATATVCTPMDTRSAEEYACINAGSGLMLPPTRWGAITLAPSPGNTNCFAVGPNRLSCSLGPDGTANFDVLRLSTKTDINGFWVPLCLTAPIEPSENSVLSQEQAIALTSDAPLQASELMFQDLGPVPTSRPKGCNDPAASCTRGELMTLELVGVQPLPTQDAGTAGGSSSGGSSNGGGSNGGAAGAEAGSESTPPETADASAPSPTPTAIAAQEPLHALLTITPLSTSTVSPYLVSGSDCSGARISEVTFAAGTATSQPFSVCTTGSAAKYRLSANLVEQRSISTQLSDDRSFLPDAVQSVDVPSASRDPFVVRLCGGATASATQATVAGKGIVLSDQGYVFSAAAPAETGGASAGGSPSAAAGATGDAGAPTEPASAGGASTSGGSSSSGDTPSTGTATVTLRDGSSCTVEFTR